MWGKASMPTLAMIARWAQTTQERRSGDTMSTDQITKALPWRPGALRIFSLVDPADQEFSDEFEKSLFLLKRSGDFHFVRNLDLAAGLNIDDQISLAIQTAHLIIFFASPSFLSNQQFEKAVNLALVRRTKEKIPVLPLLVRECSIDDSEFRGWRTLPISKVPVSTSKKRDSAWQEVLTDLKLFLTSLDRLVDRAAPEVLRVTLSNLFSLKFENLVGDLGVDFSTLDSDQTKAAEELVQIMQQREDGLRLLAAQVAALKK
jgi:hypothetical protein